MTEREMDTRNETTNDSDSPSEALRRQIAVAFDRPELINDDRMLPHRECVILRRKLHHFLYDDLRRYLPVVLIDILIHPAASFLDSEYADMVIYYLDADIEPFVVEGEQVDWDVEGRLKRDQYELFGRFDRSEALAVVAWLTTIESWPMFDLCREEIASARSYWLQRVKSQS